MAKTDNGNNGKWQQLQYYYVYIIMLYEVTEKKFLFIFY